MSDTPDYPHVPASFINAIREEGTKDEACDWLQRQWNEICALREELAASEAQVTELNALLSKNLNAELLDQQQADQERITELTAALYAIQHYEQGYAPELRAIARAALVKGADHE